MSTRAIIEFCNIVDGKKVCDGVKIYQHTDGYPRWTVNRLQVLRDILKQTKMERDNSYAAANYIFLEKLRYLVALIEILSEEGDLEKADIELSVRTIDSGEFFKQEYFPNSFLRFGVLPSDTAMGEAGDEWYYKVYIPLAEHPPSEQDWEVEIYKVKGINRGELVYSGSLEEVNPDALED